MITIKGFVIPMRKLELKSFKDLIELDKNNGYLKAGKRNKNVYLIKSCSNIYYLKIALDDEDISIINLSDNYRKAIRRATKILRHFQKCNDIFKVYDQINIIFQKEEENE
ncbi:hypothetical protein PMY38_07730 [Clostridium tertium]|uniref:hypothetical protein n=1 Tax=Clostridium tertium TaxID=1559 RepID=UPI00232BAB5F|nr:hypothetical protein [Clostridium tertium]MDB1956611.1 hypothetical protein [Clostridium tertium]MDB1958482.1 hypothetical protein [Clostridium tertium]MDB1962373.1 hypothetical protein [Clostridium tertium]MDB1967663.1 hypothetical protein [Clostridium tertium]